MDKMDKLVKALNNVEIMDSEVSTGEAEDPMMADINKKIKILAESLEKDLSGHNEELNLMSLREYAFPLIALTKETIQQDNFFTGRFHLIALKVLIKTAKMEAAENGDDINSDWLYCFNYEANDCEFRYYFKFIKYHWLLKEKVIEVDKAKVKFDELRAEYLIKSMNPADVREYGNFPTTKPNFDEAENIAGIIIKLRNFTLDNYAEYKERKQRLKAESKEPVRVEKFFDDSYSIEFHRDYLRAQLYQFLSSFCEKHKISCKLSKKAIELWEPLRNVIPKEDYARLIGINRLLLHSIDSIEDHRRILLLFCKRPEQDKCVRELKETIQKKNVILKEFKESIEKNEAEKEFLEDYFVVTYDLVRTFRDITNLTNADDVFVSFYTMKLAELLVTYPQTIEMFNYRTDLQVSGMTQMEVAEKIQANLRHL